jgi:hypothetical protein
MAFTQHDMKKVTEDIEKGQPISITDYVAHLTATNPNDADLGAAVRELIIKLQNVG